MELKKKKLTTFIGRFSPNHLGHVATLERALKTSEVVLVLIGSSGQARTTKNPFTFSERMEMIAEWYATTRSGDIAHDPPYVVGNYGTLRIEPIYDYPYNDNMWIAQIQAIVEKVKKEFKVTGKTHLTGSDRDRSTWYLHAFGSFFDEDFVDKSIPLGMEMSATKVRELLFTGNIDILVDMVPPTTFRFLTKFKESPAFPDLVKEFQYIEDYKSRWDIPNRADIAQRVGTLLDQLATAQPQNQDAIRDELDPILNHLFNLAPYPPTFTTVDAVVIQSGHVLVNVRGNFPGVGLWALPGGFLEQSEKLVDGCVRELTEETRIELAKAQLYGSIVDHETFDLPDRSLRGRTITTAFLFQLDDTKPLPKVKPQKGEVKSVSWIPIHEALSRTDMWFEDHLSILQTMYGRLSQKQR